MSACRAARASAVEDLTPRVRRSGTPPRRLLDRIAGGDAGATGELLARHRPALAGFVGLRLAPAVRGRVNPSDVVQEAQADMARQLPNYLARRPMPFYL